MAKHKYRIINIFILLFLTTGSSPCQEKPDRNDEQYYYFYYEVSENQEVLKAIPAGLPRGTPVTIVLDSVLKYLSENYFNAYGELYTDTNIKLHVTKIDSITTTSRIYKIAIINIDDGDKICRTTFFQGSLGGSMTQTMLAVNILQPQYAFNVPLLDGAIILYNGSPVTELDHIDIDGILVPKTFQMNASGAINRSRKKK